MNRPSALHVVLMLTRRELVKLFRAPMRVVGILATPILLWVFMASGFADALQPQHLGETNYAAFLLPGMLTLTVMFASLLAGFAIIEDRNEGWLRAVLAAPVPRWSIALGRTLGGAIVALIQALLLLPALLLLDVSTSVTGMVLVLVALVLTSLAMTALSIALAWRCDTTSSFHSVMNLLFLPLWLLSGAFFPVQGASTWLIWITRCNPLGWCNRAIADGLHASLIGWPMLAALGFAGVMVLVATAIITRPGKQAV
jgi:ABC-2 type transport system permease protein